MRREIPSLGEVLLVFFRKGRSEGGCIELLTLSTKPQEQRDLKVNWMQALSA